MAKIIVVNVYMATKEEFMNSVDVPFVAISVVSPDYPKYELFPNENCQEVLYQRFHDINHEGEVRSLQPIEEDLIIFDESHARTIVEFILKHEDKENWLIHCEAGVSRSPGIAMAASEILNGPKSPERWIETIYGHKQFGEKFIREKHNRLVKDLILKTYYENYKKTVSL